MEQLSPKVYSWATDLDYNTVDQAIKSSKLDIIPTHIALMPDAHLGAGATVGSVIPTKDAVIPAAVGVDIGCGMCAVKLKLKADQLPDDLSKLHNLISRSIPAGVGRGHEDGSGPAGKTSGFPDWPTDTAHWDKKAKATALKQFGTLGSGNHFVEVCVDEEDYVWVVLHSGSRGIGNQLARKHIETANGVMKQMEIKLEDKDLSYLIEGTPEFQLYIQDMLWSQDYAMGNRQAMMKAVLADVSVALGNKFPGVSETINCHHNFTQREEHNGEQVWLTRKGAIQAGVGDRGIIPGSMGTETYIVSGLGNPWSFNSCSHGAGRRMSRNQAKKTLTVESLKKSMKGKTWNSDAKLLDEHPDAYKDIKQVMENQKDLVKIDHTLNQILNFKGL